MDTLEELYLAHNGIDDNGASCETGLSMTFTNLNVLDLSRNRLTSTRPLAHLPALEELWISGNQIATFDDVISLKESAEAGIQSLDTVYLEYNPIASEFEYRKRLKEWIPNLSQIDATMIGGLGGIAASIPNAGMARPTAATAATMTTMTPEQLQQAVIDRARQEQAKQQQQQEEEERRLND
jgi:protein phosphatase 1 regulatory subunit 7